METNKRTQDAKKLTYSRCGSGFDIYEDGENGGETLAHVKRARNETDEETKTFAALICHAVNNYTSLLDALKTVSNVLSDWNSDGKYTNLIEHANAAIKATESND